MSFFLSIPHPALSLSTGSAVKVSFSEVESRGNTATVSDVWAGVAKHVRTVEKKAANGEVTYDSLDKAAELVAALAPKAECTSSVWANSTELCPPQAFRGASRSCAVFMCHSRRLL